MREAMVVGAVVLMALGLTGCGKGPAETAAPVAPAPQQVAAAAAVAAPDDIPELPSYPGAERVKREIDASGGEWARKSRIELVSNDGFEKVRAFYLEAIRANGWQVVGTREEKDEIGWKLAKGTSMAEVDLDSEGFGRVKIKLERKDR